MSFKLRVAICGGGVGGVMSALILSKYPDIDFDVYEAATTFSEIGAGITVWPRTWNMLRKLGLIEDLIKIVGKPPAEDDTLSFHYRISDRSEGTDFFKLISKGTMLTVHRAEFHRILLSHLPKTCRTHTSKRLCHYRQSKSGPIELSFEDGTFATCDLLIGADGIKSCVRRVLLEEKAHQAQVKGNFELAKKLVSLIEPVWSGSIVYRCLIPAGRLQEKSPNHGALTAPMQYSGCDANMVAYTISHGTKVNVAAYKANYDLWGTKYDGPWVVENVDDEIRDIYTGWEPEVQDILDCIEKPTRWAVHVSQPLDSYVSGRVAILGDAAHAMVPHQGSGGGQAIEDSIVLATLLGHRLATIDTIPLVLEIYNKVRQPFANDIAKRSVESGKCAALQCDGFDFKKCSEEEGAEKLKELGDSICQISEWTWKTRLDSALEEAVGMLEGSVHRLKHSEVQSRAHM